MNIAQMEIFPMKRLEGKKSSKNLSGISEQSARQDRLKKRDFSKVFGNALDKTEVRKPGDSKSRPSNSKDSLPKASSQENGRDMLTQTVKGLEDSQQKTDKANADVKESDATNPILLQQIAELLKLFGIPVDEKVLVENGGLVQETTKQQAQAGSIPQEQIAGEAVSRLIKMLEQLTANGKNIKGNAFIEELKGLTEPQLNGLSSLQDEKFLAKLINVLEKYLGEDFPKTSPSQTSGHVPTAESKSLLPVNESVSDSLTGEGGFEQGTSANNQNLHTQGKSIDMNMKGFESLGREAAQNGNKGPTLNQLDTINPHNIPTAVSGNVFNAVAEAMGSEQPNSVYKLTQDIFGQIAQKAKVITLPGGAEMQIELKPDFLGRLNMIISSENGTVTARFSAESHAVKAIIEANLNSLKDTLNQQGIKVDQLVVDVGTHNHQPGFEQRQSMYKGHNSGKNNRDLVSTEEVERLFTTENQKGSLKGYYGSSIEFTA